MAGARRAGGVPRQPADVAVTWSSRAGADVGAASASRTRSHGSQRLQSSRRGVERGAQPRGGAGRVDEQVRVVHAAAVERERFDAAVRIADARPASVPGSSITPQCRAKARIIAA